MKGLLLFLLGTQSAWAGTVLMPAFMPETPEDQANADRFHDALLIELIAEGYTAIGQDALRSRVGSIVDTCAVTTDCPTRLFAAWPAPVAVVGEVYADGDDIGVVTSVYVPASTSPVQVFDQTVSAGSDWQGVASVLEVIAANVPEGDIEEGALGLLEQDMADIEAVQAEGLAAEAAAATVVERLGYIEEEEPMSDEEILSLLGIGEDAEPEAPAEDPLESGQLAPVASDLPEEPVVADAEPQEVSTEDPEIEPRDEEPSEEVTNPVVEEEVEEEVEEDLVEVLEDPIELLLEAEIAESQEPAETDEAPAAIEVDVVDIPVREDAPMPPEPSEYGLDYGMEEIAEEVFYDRPSREELNLDSVLYRSLTRSTMTTEGWFEKFRPHVNNGHIEVFGGVPYGDTVRQYDVRLALDSASLQEIGSSERDLFVEGVGYEVGVSFGFTPTPWLDLSTLFSIMGGPKNLTTGWATIEGSQVIDQYVLEHTPSVSFQGIVEPRVRAYLVPVGWLKVYGLSGITVRFADSYKIESYEKIEFPGRPSWTMLGWMVGGGLMFDPSDRIGIYLEAPWVHWFPPGDKYESKMGTAPPFLLDVVQRTGWILRGTLGVQIRL